MNVSNKSEYDNLIMNERQTGPTIPQNFFPLKSSKVGGAL